MQYYHLPYSDQMLQSSLFHYYISECIAQCVVFTMEDKGHAGDVIHIIHGQLSGARCVH